MGSGSRGRDLLAHHDIILMQILCPNLIQFMARRPRQHNHEIVSKGPVTTETRLHHPPSEVRARALRKTVFYKCRLNSLAEILQKIFLEMAKTMFRSWTPKIFPENRRKKFRVRGKLLLQSLNTWCDCISVRCSTNWNSIYKTIKITKSIINSMFLQFLGIYLIFFFYTVLK